MVETLRVVITGRVQGVGYRAWTVKTASSLGLKGWVRNRSDGSVEAVFHGMKETIESMVEACKKGPFMARVDGIQSFKWEQAVEDMAFVAKPTA